MEMATREVRTSDLDGAQGAEPVTIGWQGQWYEVDLTGPQKEECQGLLSGYLAVARRDVPDRPPRVITIPDREKREAMRAWGRANGMSVADKGSIPKRVYRAYLAAHPGEEV